MNTKLACIVFGLTFVIVDLAVGVDTGVKGVVTCPKGAPIENVFVATHSFGTEVDSPAHPDVHELMTTAADGTYESGQSYADDKYAITFFKPTGYTGFYSPIALRSADYVSTFWKRDPNHRVEVNAVIFIENDSECGDY